MTADSEGNQQEFRVVLADASDPTIEANPLKTIISQGILRRSTSAHSA
jgi:hypothetical protein